jgi:hypothetical protein
MKKNKNPERTPARRLSREELETGVLAAGCGTQGCLTPWNPGGSVINPPWRPVLPIRPIRPVRPF